MLKTILLLFLLAFLTGCYSPQQKALAAKCEHQALQAQLKKVSRLDSVICKTVADFKLPSCFMGQELKASLCTAMMDSIGKCSSCKMADSVFLHGKEYYSLNVELRKPANAPLSLFIGYTFLSDAPEPHGLGVLYELVRIKDSLYINHESVPRQWME